MSANRSTDPRPPHAERCHHLHPSSVQEMVALAEGRAGIAKPCTPHVLRHAFATHLLRGGYDIRAVQELIGHSDVAKTMVDMHVLNKGCRDVRSPFDG